MVAATENFVGNLITFSNISDDNLFAFSNHNSVDSTCIMSSTRTTPTESFNLESVHSVSKLNEAG